MQVLLVKWRDSVTHDNWAAVADVEKSCPKLIYAVGFLISDNADKITLALLNSDDGVSVASWVNIPKECIVATKILTDFIWEDDVFAERKCDSYSLPTS